MGFKGVLGFIGFTGFIGFRFRVYDSHNSLAGVRALGFGFSGFKPHTLEMFPLILMGSPTTPSILPPPLIWP